MSLVAALPWGNIDKIAEIANIGVDAIVTRIEDSQGETQALKSIAQVVGGAPWGVWLKSVDKEGIKQLTEAKCDFLIFEAPTTSPALLQEKEMGKVIKMDPSLDDSLVKAIDQLPIDALLIEEEKGTLLNIYHLMHYQRIRSLISKPLLVTTRFKLADSDIQALRDIGVKGVIVEGEGEWLKQEIARLHQVIGALPPAPKGGRERREALLPRLEQEISSAPPEEVSFPHVSQCLRGEGKWSEYYKSPYSQEQEDF
jgi:hypothetical protein